jgi:hypothetical protein
MTVSPHPHWQRKPYSWPSADAPPIAMVVVRSCSLKVLARSPSLRVPASAPSTRLYGRETARFRAAPFSWCPTACKIALVELGTRTRSHGKSHECRKHVSHSQDPQFHSCSFQWRHPNGLARIVRSLRIRASPFCVNRNGVYGRLTEASYPTLTGSAAGRSGSAHKQILARYTVGSATRGHSAGSGILVRLAFTALAG